MCIWQYVFRWMEVRSYYFVVAVNSLFSLYMLLRPMIHVAIKRL